MSGVVKQPQQSNVKKSAKVSKRNKRRNNRNRRMKTVKSSQRFQAGLTQTTRVKRKELLATGTLSGNSYIINHHIFDAASGPAWFKKMCNMYEKYKMHSVDIEVVFGGSKMTKGVYVLSYNTNYDQKADTVSESALLAQKGAKQVCAADQIARIHVNGSGLTGYSTTLPTTGINSYCFDAIIAGTPAETVTYTINIYYDATFYNPQISD